MRGTINVPSCYVLIRQANKVLFLMRENTGFMDGYYCLPSGHVESMESFKKAAVREVEEETGLKVKPKDLKHIFTLHRKADEGDHVRVDVFFAADSWQGEPKNAEPTKHSHLEWLDIENLPENVMDYVSHAMRHLVQGNNYAEYGWEKA